MTEQTVTRLVRARDLRPGMAVHRTYFDPQTLRSQEQRIVLLDAETHVVSLFSEDRSTSCIGVDQDGEQVQLTTADGCIHRVEVQGLDVQVEDGAP